jgi:hypothetical protein
MLDAIEELARLNEQAAVERRNGPAGSAAPRTTSDYVLTPLDWDAEADPVEMLAEPYVPRGARVWAFGAAESGKSLWALHVAAELSRKGSRVVFFSEENPRKEDVRRLQRLRADRQFLAFYHAQGIDLRDPGWIAAILAAASDATLIVFDTLTAAWPGDENDNAAITAFDRDVLSRFVRELGVTVIVLDHAGHPQQFVKRSGVNAGRGASSKGQKADVVLVFRADRRSGRDGFILTHAKNRFGGIKEPDVFLCPVDDEDGSLRLELTLEPGATDRAQARERALAILAERPGEFTKTALAERLGCRKEDALTVIGELLESGEIGPDKPKARLMLGNSENTIPELEL